jgi:hypothetical protein
MWEVGAARTGLAYHIATSIALHELFTELPHSPSRVLRSTTSRVRCIPPRHGGAVDVAAEVAEDASGHALRGPRPVGGRRQ